MEEIFNFSMIVVKRVLANTYLSPKYIIPFGQCFEINFMNFLCFMKW